METIDILSLVIGGLLAVIVLVLLRIINRANRGRISLEWNIDHKRPDNVDDETETGEDGCQE